MLQYEGPLLEEKSITKWKPLRNKVAHEEFQQKKKNKFTTWTLTIPKKNLFQTTS